MVLSDITDLNNLELAAVHVTEGFITGRHKSPFHGFSSEFNEHRLYNKGESTRHIDWKLYARTEKLFVKRYEDETNLRCHILIDTSPSMKYPRDAKYNKLDFSAVCAAAIINLLKKQRDAAALTLFNKKIEFSSDAKISALHIKMLFSKLEEVVSNRNFNPSLDNQSDEGSIAECLHQIAENIHKRSLVIVFSDMFDCGQENNLFAALQHLRHAKHDVIVFHVCDKRTELDFNFENRPYKFYDMETGKMLTLNPFEFKDVYKKQSSEYLKKLKARCGMYGMDLVEADIAMPFKDIIAPYLIRRSRIAL